MPEPIHLSSAKIVDFKSKNMIGLNDKSLGLESEAFDERVCENHDVSNQSLADSAIKRNAGNAMVTNFFQVPRSLTRSQIWISLSALDKVVFMTILDYARFEATEFNDFGDIINIEIGEYCVSRVDLANLCGSFDGKKKITQKQIENSLLRLQKLDFLGRRLGKQRNILIIKHPDTYALIKNEHGQASGQALGKLWASSGQQSNNVNNVNNEKTEFKKDEHVVCGNVHNSKIKEEIVNSSFACASVFSSAEPKTFSFDDLTAYTFADSSKVKPDTTLRWCRTYSFEDLFSALNYYQMMRLKKSIPKPEAYVETVLKERLLEKLERREYYKKKEKDHEQEKKKRNEEWK